MINCRGERCLLDMSQSKVLMPGEELEEASARLVGNLPTPCNQLRVVMSPATTDNQINLEVYSVVDAHTICIEVLLPFEVIYPLGSFHAAGHYTVYANGELLGELDE